MGGTETERIFMKGVTFSNISTQKCCILQVPPGGTGLYPIPYYCRYIHPQPFGKILMQAATNTLVSHIEWTPELNRVSPTSNEFFSSAHSLKCLRCPYECYRDLTRDVNDFSVVFYLLAAQPHQ